MHFQQYFFLLYIAQSCSTSNSLRLYNQYGSTATQGGMLQVCRSNQWRAVCDRRFDCSTEGRAACRQLGFSGSLLSESEFCQNFVRILSSSDYIHIESYTISNSARYFGTWSYTSSYYYSCSSSGYSSLTSCIRFDPPSQSYCNSDDQVGLWCETVPSTGKMHVIR